LKPIYKGKLPPQIAKPYERYQQALERNHPPATSF